MLSYRFDYPYIVDAHESHGCNVARDSAEYHIAQASATPVIPSEPAASPVGI